MAMLFPQQNPVIIFSGGKAVLNFQQYPNPFVPTNLIMGPQFYYGQITGTQLVLLLYFPICYPMHDPLISLLEMPISKRLLHLFHLPLSHIAFDEFQIFSKLRQTVLSINEYDHWVYPQGSGFSVSKAYAFLRQRKYPMPPHVSF